MFSIYRIHFLAFFSSLFLLWTNASYSHELKDSSQSPSQYLITLGLSDIGEVLLISPKVNNNSIEVASLKKGLLVVAIFDQDPRNLTDTQLEEDLICKIQNDPNQVLVFIDPSPKLSKLKIPNSSRSNFYLAAFNFDSLDSAHLEWTIREGIRLGNFDMLLPQKIRLDTKTIEEP